MPTITYVALLAYTTREYTEKYWKLTNIHKEKYAAYIVWMVLE